MNSVNYLYFITKGLFLLIFSQIWYVHSPLYNHIDDRLMLYVNQYETLAKIACNSEFNIKSIPRFKMSVADLDDSAGECRNYLARRHIVIDPNVLEKYNTKYVQQIVFHELSHCILGMDHVEDNSNYMHSSSYPNLFSMELYYQVFKDISERCNEINEQI